MRFFSKITFLFNCCFLVLLFFYFNKSYISNAAVPRPLGVLKGSVVVLAEISWITNIVFVLIILLQYAFKKVITVPRLLLIFNVLVLAAQLYFYFIDRS